MGCPKEKSTGLEGLFNFQVHEAKEYDQKYLYLYLISFLLKQSLSIQSASEK